MKPDWDKLIAEYADSSVVGVYDVDCTAQGKMLCQEAGVRGYPTILHGDPSNIKALAKYNGARTYDALSEFAKATLLDGPPVALLAPPSKPAERPTAKPIAGKGAPKPKPKPNAGKVAKGSPGKGWPKASPKAPVKPMAGRTTTGKPKLGSKAPPRKTTQSAARRPPPRKPPLQGKGKATPRNVAGAKPSQGQGKVPEPGPRPHRKHPATGGAMGGAHDPAAMAAAAQREAVARTSKMGVPSAAGTMGPAAAEPADGASAAKVGQRVADAQRRAAAQQKLHGKHQADNRRKNAEAAARRQAAEAAKKREL